MAVTDQNWAHWLERLYNLRRDKRGTHERPHKPVLLLAILDLLDRGVIRINAEPFNEELVATFRRWFAVVSSEDDQPTLENPFYFLGGDKFWQVFPTGQSEPLYREGFAGGAPSPGQLRKQAAIGRFDEGLWPLLSEPLARHQLREALIARYFPEHRGQLAALVAGSGQTTHLAGRAAGTTWPAIAGPRAPLSGGGRRRTADRPGGRVPDPRRGPARFPGGGDRASAGEGIRRRSRNDHLTPPMSDP